ncbi:HAMP domain-containing histidine kinase [Spirosoma sp. RP8]|uniref:histidine kinase n=1 Tax=Spirosoma liriopis TaxID=2937440 RepID=A0ABT0HIU1_9BACT|nr:HAMP domain-containing sensor histidine kinase [Spirosoma liriopis]MCK8492075.1 HAMP domain-containing histidine kinase [Spirosoma liriopis]
MSTLRIRWIVALMAVGLVGLVGLQSYWISSALHLQKEQFDYKVTDGLQEVVRALERQEAMYQAKQHIQARDHQDRLMAIARKEDKKSVVESSASRKKVASATSDKVASTQAKKANPKVTDSQRLPYGMAPAGAVVVQSDVLHPVAHPLSPEQMAVVEEFFRQQDELMAVGDWQTQLAQQQQFNHWVDQILVNELNQINGQVASARRQDSLARLKASRERAKQIAKQRKSRQNVLNDSAKTEVAVSTPTSFSSNRTGEQSRMIKDVLKGLLLSERPIEDRINRLALDTLLRQALQERGINIPFAFGVRTKSQPAFLFTSLGMSPQQFSEGGYKAALFPNNMLETGNYVYVYFPTQRQFILSQLWFTFGASAVLILVILACFYIAISTIVRQKKLADIKNDFINNMTHEFKTPISTISLAVEMAQEQVRHPQGASSTDESSVNERLSRYMGIIRDETRRLGSHVEKVLQMALLDRGEIKLKLSSVNVHDVVENVLNNMSLQIEQRGGELDLEFDADREVIEADEVHVTNIVYNLLDNALKYSPESPRIALATRSLPEGVSITVTDHGLGMTKDQLSRIFEKFYRVPTGNRHDVKGFGLGLSYVKKMVDEHHGQIHVVSEPGKGSSFEVILPYNISERAKE